MPLVSVVIPVFRPPLALFESCLASMSSQTLDTGEFEVIVVYDGPATEELVHVVEAYKAACRIRSIEIARAGVSAARNTGIESAAGDWIAFVDADDQLTSDALASLLDFAVSNNCDMVLADHTKVYSDGRSEGCRYADADVLPSEEFSSRIKHDILRPTTTAGSAWAKLYRRATEGGNLPHFDENLPVGEDTEFVFRAACAAGRIGYMGRCVYLYQRNTGSVVSSFREDYEKRILASLDAMRATINAMATPDAYAEDYQDYVLFHLLLIMVHYLFHPKAPWNESERRCHYAESLDRPIFCEALGSWKWKDFSLTRNVSLLSLKYRLYSMSKAIGMIRQRQLGNVS